MAFKSQTSGEFLPYDENPKWREIFERLSGRIGNAQAYSWFGHCRFVRLQSDSLELSHWNRFSAQECLRLHGKNLCHAAKVSNIRMNFCGGTKPVCVTTPITDRRGYETFLLTASEREQVAA